MSWTDDIRARQDAASAWRRQEEQRGLTSFYEHERLLTEVVPEIVHGMQELNLTPELTQGGFKKKSAWFFDVAQTRISVFPSGEWQWGTFDIARNNQEIEAQRYSASQRRVWSYHADVTRESLLETMRKQVEQKCFERRR